MIKIQNKFGMGNVWAVFILALSVSLTSCGSTSPKIDVCKQIMRIIGRYTDLQLKALSDPQSVIADVSRTVTELKTLASNLPASPQKDYVAGLATDYGLILKQDSGMEALMALMADLTPTKIQIVCPR